MYKTIRWNPVSGIPAVIKGVAGVRKSMAAFQIFAY